MNILIFEYLLFLVFILFVVWFSQVLPPFYVFHLNFPLSNEETVVLNTLS